jgi:hypothetical protein
MSEKAESNRPEMKRPVSVRKIVKRSVFAIICGLVAWGMASAIQGWREDSAKQRAEEIAILNELDVEITNEPGLGDFYTGIIGTCTMRIEFTDENTIVFESSDIRQVTVPRDTDTPLPDTAGLRECF